MDSDSLVYEISAIDLRLAVVPDEDLLGCSDLMEARRILIEALANCPTPASLTDLRELMAATARLTARVRLERERAVGALGDNRRGQSLIRALRTPAASHSSYFG